MPFQFQQYHNMAGGHYQGYQHQQQQLPRPPYYYEKLFDEKKIPASDLARQFNSLGICQWKLGEYQEAIGFYIRGQDLIQTPGTNEERKMLGHIYNNKAICHRNLKQYDQALDDYRKSLD